MLYSLSHLPERKNKHSVRYEHGLRQLSFRTFRRSAIKYYRKLFICFDSTLISNMIKIDKSHDVQGCPLPSTNGGERGQHLPLREKTWVFFLYSVKKKCSQNFIFQPSGNLNIKKFPLGTNTMSPLIKHWL